MGCVWQSDYAPAPGPGEARAYYRPSARHRKPPLWLRAGKQLMPFLATASVRYRPRVRPAHSARVAPLGRGR
jgi:hypothetical protein